MYFPLIPHQSCDFRDEGVGCMRRLSQKVSSLFSFTQVVKSEIGKVEYMCKLNDKVSLISKDTSNVVEGKHGPKQPKDTLLEKKKKETLLNNKEKLLTNKNTLLKIRKRF